MAESDLYTLGQTAALLGEAQSLISFLVRDRSIPTRTFGNAVVIDEDGISRLRQEISKFNSKRPLRRRRRSVSARS